jgi:uncharacterized FlaG/YvyC family protein
MVNIQNLGADFFRRIAQQKTAKPEGERIVKKASATPVALPKDVAKTMKKSETAREPWDFNDNRARIEAEAQLRERLKPETRSMSFDELAEMFRKVNLTLDLFEIQARFSVNEESGDISVVVLNQRTGEVIRRIPPFEVNKLAESLLKEQGMITDIKA